MSTGIDFDEDKFNYSARPQPNSAAGKAQFSTAQGGGMAGWMVRKGWVKTEEGAQKILIGLVVVNFIITFAIIIYFV